jgi:hypothetical protein
MLLYLSAKMETVSTSNCNSKLVIWKNQLIEEMVNWTFFRQGVHRIRTKMGTLKKSYEKNRTNVNMCKESGQKWI